MLSDISRLEKNLSKLEKSIKSSDQFKKEFDLLKEVKLSLEKGILDMIFYDTTI